MSHITKTIILLHTPRVFPRTHIVKGAKKTRAAHLEATALTHRLDMAAV